MELNLIYSTLDSPTTATMRIYQDISMFGVDCSMFVRELDTLITAGVTDISVRINSYGGSVFDGFGIFSALRACKANVTTYNDGLAASTAGWIFLAGDKAVMNDFSWLMMHNPMTCDATEKGLEVLSGIRQSIITILSKKSGQTPETIGAMMDEETWLSAEACKELGFVTEIEETEALIKLNPMEQTKTEMMNIVNSALALEAPEKVEVVEQAEEVTNEVVEEIVAEEVVPEIVNEVEETDAEKLALKLKNEELEAKVAELSEKFEDFSNRLTVSDAALAVYKAEEAEKLRLEEVNKVTNLVDSAIAEGKITGNSREKWLNLAKLDFASAEDAIKDLSTVKRSVNVMEAVINKEGTVAKKTLRDYDKEGKLPEMYEKNRALYNQLFFEQYGKHPQD